MGLGTNFFDGDGLLRKYGTTKAIPNKGGEYKTYGDVRELEFKLDISTLTTTATTISDQVFWPKGVFLEEVTLECQTAFATSTSFSVGLLQSNDRTTSVSDTAFVNALTSASGSLDTAGKRVTLVTGSTSAGSLMGTVPIAANAAFSGYVTAKIAGSAGTGIILVRIKYRPVV